MKNIILGILLILIPVLFYADAHSEEIFEWVEDTFQQTTYNIDNTYYVEHPHFSDLYSNIDSVFDEIIAITPLESDSEIYYRENDIRIIMHDEIYEIDSLHYGVERDTEFYDVTTCNNWGTNENLYCQHIDDDGNEMIIEDELKSTDTLTVQEYLDTISGIEFEYLLSLMGYDDINQIDDMVVSIIFEDYDNELVFSSYSDDEILIFYTDDHIDFISSGDNVDLTKYISVFIEIQEDSGETIALFIFDTIKE